MSTRLPGSYAGVGALVLGGTGFIGRRVVRALAAHGALVTVSGRDAAAVAACLRDLPDTAATGSVSNLTIADELASLLKAARPAIVFNLAGYGVDRAERDEAVAMELNAALPARLAELMSDRRADGWNGLALVHAGSALEYGTAAGDLDETTPPQPTTLYGRTKLEGTEAVAAAAAGGLPAATARLFTVYGPGEHAGRLLPALLDAARTRRPLDLTSGAQRRDFTYVDDVAEGLLRLGACPRVSPVVNLATGRLETVRGFAERAARVLGIEPGLLRFGAVPVRVEEMAHDPVSIARLSTLLDWVPATGIEHGVQLTLHEMSQVANA